MPHEEEQAGFEVGLRSAGWWSDWPSTELSAESDTRTGVPIPGARSRPSCAIRLEAALARPAALVEPSGAALAHVALDVLVDQHLPVTVRAAEVAEELEEGLDPGSERESLAGASSG